MWTSLRKGGTDLHISYGHAHTNNLYGHDVRVRTEPSVELSMDLNPNLRARNKTSNSHIDARELVDGGLDRLTMVQLHDNYIFEGLGRVLGQLDEVPREWTLTIELKGRHSFRIRPETKAGSLLCAEKRLGPTTLRTGFRLATWPSCPLRAALSNT